LLGSTGLFEAPAGSGGPYFKTPTAEHGSTPYSNLSKVPILPAPENRYLVERRAATRQINLYLSGFLGVFELQQGVDDTTLEPHCRGGFYSTLTSVQGPKKSS